MAVSMGEIHGAITARFGDNEPAEVATFTLPLTVSTGLHTDGPGVVISGMDKLNRALKAFGDVIDEE